MYAKWIGPDWWVGPKNGGKWAIKHGDIRKVHAKKDDQYILASEDGKGYFGWVNEKDVEICQEKN
jgi:hypothetical protein